MDPTNRRRAPRRGLKAGPLPGRLMNFDMTRQLVAEGIDVSRNGIGVLTDHALKSGDEVWYAVQDRILRLKVQHCTPAEEGRYRCGFYVGHSWESIDRLMDRIGCVEVSGPS
jgi:hypothetical protein